MHCRRRCFLFFVACWFAFAAVSQSGLAQQLPENYQNLKLYELDRACDELVNNGFTPANRADAFAEWMAANEWQSLELHNLYNLYSWVNTSAVDRRHFSVRWTGTLTAPATAAYTLHQVQVYKGRDCRLKVTIGGQLALNSDSDSTSPEKFSSQPIQLTASQAVPIQVEMVHSVGEINNFGESVPIVTLTWSTNQLSKSIIPTTAYSPPAEFAPAGTRGLKGEYFGNTQFGDLKTTRLDAALDFAWSWPPAVSIHEQEARQVLVACKSKILNGEFLSQSAAEGKSSVYNYNVWLVAFQMTATERRQLVESLKGKPDVLVKLSPEGIGRLFQAIYILPGDEHLDLLGEWALVHSQPRCEAGIFPGWGDGYYQKLNTDYYWLMGRFMHGPYANDAETLCDRYLERPNGDCNLGVAYAAAYASQLNRTPEKLIERLDARISDQAVTGDKLVTWLIARAFAKGAVPSRLEPLAGYSDLESALVAAESSDQKFWVLQEMVARLSSVNKADKAKTLIEEHRSEFNTQAQQQAMNQWSAKADALATTYAERAVVKKQTAKTAYRNELERRRQAAIDRGDEAAANRFAELLSATQ